MNSNETNESKDTKEMKEEFTDREMRRFGRRHGWKFAAIFAFVVLAKSALVLLLWNYLIPDLFHGPVVNYGQAIGLVVLAKLLIGFKGLHHFDRGGRHFGPHGHRGHHRWANLSQEEREKIREHMRARHCR